MVVTNENLTISITLTYRDYSLCGTLISAFSGLMHHYIVIETVKYLFIFNTNDVQVTKLTVMYNEGNYTYSHYDKNKIREFLSRLYVNKVNCLTPRLGVKNLEISRTIDKNTVELDIEESDFISEVVGEKTVKSKKKAAVSKTDVTGITQGYKGYNSINNTYNYWERRPQLLGNLDDIFEGNNYENNRKSIGYATVGSSNKGK